MGEAAKQLTVGGDGGGGGQLQAVIEAMSRAAADPAVDTDKMKAILDMQERILNRNAEMAFNAAMSAAQADMGRVATDADNPHTKSRYASYAALDRHLRPIYTRHGFALSFDTGEPVAEMVRLLCHVSHFSGHTRTYHVDMPADGKGAKGGDVMTKTHAAGAAMSYGMRYLLKMIFNVAVGEDDNDGNDFIQTISDDQLLKLEAKIGEVDDSAYKRRFMAHYEIEKLADLPLETFEAAYRSVENKIAEDEKKRKGGK